MEKYRIVEVTKHDGSKGYNVQWWQEYEMLVRILHFIFYRSLSKGEWVQIYSFDTLEAAEKIMKIKLDAQIVSEVEVKQYNTPPKC